MYKTNFTKDLSLLIISSQKRYIQKSHSNVEGNHDFSSRPHMDRSRNVCVYFSKTCLHWKKSQLFQHFLHHQLCLRGYPWTAFNLLPFQCWNEKHFYRKSIYWTGSWGRKSTEKNNSLKLTIF